MTLDTFQFYYTPICISYFFNRPHYFKYVLFFWSRRVDQNQNRNITCKINTAGSLGAEAVKCALYITHDKTLKKTFKFVQIRLIFIVSLKNQNHNRNIIFKIYTAGSLGAEALKCVLYITHNKTFFEIVQISTNIAYFSCLAERAETRIEI